MSEESLPKEQLLLKLLRMTTSSHDNEALTAIRKVNDLLTGANWTWDKLIAGKIVVVADPFAGIGEPPRPDRMTAPQPQAKPPTASAPPQAPSWTPPPSPPPKHTTWPLTGSARIVNRFPGFCYCCANELIAGAGLLFNPSWHNSLAPDKLVPVCNTCNQSAKVKAGAAIRTNPRKKSVTDLA